MYKNNHTPAAGDASSTYISNQADFSGYSAVNSSGWAAPTDSGSKATSVATDITWTVSSSPATTNNIYGYFVTSSADATKVLFAERFTGAPLAMATGGDQIVLTPEFEMQTLA